MRVSSPRLVLAALLIRQAASRTSSLRRVELPSELNVDANDDADYEIDMDAMMLAMEEEEEQRRLMEEPMDMGMDHTHKNFSPLPCNDAIDWDAECAEGTASKLSDLVNAAGSNKVVVQCGKCALADTTDGSTLSIPGGLTVQGKLHFPASAKLTVRTTSVVVEGIFSTDSPAAGTTIPAADGSGVKIVLHGKDHVSFTPHSHNHMACGGNMTNPEACDVGKRAFVVAGGKLDVKAIDPQCPSWVPLLDTSSTQTPPDMPTPGPKPVVNEEIGCTRTPFSVDFKVGDALPTKFGSGGQLSIHALDETATSQGDPAYVSMTSRNHPHNGPTFKMNSACFIPGAEYIFQARVRLRGENGNIARCTAGGAGGYNLRYRVTNRGYWDLTAQNGCKFVQDNEWFMIDRRITMNAGQIGTGDINTWFWNVEAGTAVDIDYVKISMPDDEDIPEDNAEGCLDLVNGNGDAESSSGSVWPWTSSNGDNYLHILEEEDATMPGGVNHFYRQERPQSWWGMWYKKHGFTTPCVQDGVEYTFKLRWRYNSDNAKGLALRFGYNNGGWKWKYLGSCPASSTAIGWVDCEKTMEAPAGSGSATGYQIWTYNQDGSAPHPSIDYDDISFSRSYDPPVMPQDVLHVGTDAAKCWGAGSELLLTSATTHQDDAHKVTVLSSDSAAGKITLSEGVPHTTTEADDADFPVEVALLDRNFKLQAEIDADDVTAGNDDNLHGGHLMVLHTPTVEQTLEGVEIDGFGQQGELGRYPVHFHMCDAVEGSLISRNVIKNSKQRGIVVHGTHNLTVSDNVLVDIKGHGYFLEDGAENHNRFYRNLGALFYPVAKLVPSGNVETDKQPSVFWMSNTMNTWEGNVAAGGHIGFWIEMQDGGVRGPSAAMGDFASNHRQKVPLTKFKDNSAHSSSFCGMSAYPNRYDPTEVAVLENLRVYRNGDCGILFHVDNGMTMVGGVAADNKRRQVWNQLASNIVLDGTKIFGARPEFKAGMARAGKSVHCTGGNVMEGVTYSVNSIFGPSRGLTLTNVNFDHFDCGSNSVAIQAEPRRTDNGGIYDSVSAINGVTFGDKVPASSKVSTCAVQNLSVNPSHSVALEDTNGNLGGGMPGFLVSDNDVMKGFAAVECTTVDGTCMAYCPGACLQTFIIQTNSMSNAVEMEINDENGNVVKVAAANVGQVSTSNSGSTQTAVVNGDLTFTWSKSSYGMSLPSGTITATFRDAQGAVTYPDFIVFAKQAEPLCTKAETVVDIVKPSPTREACNELIGSGSFEGGTTDAERMYGWKTFFTNLEIASPGFESNYALKAANRNVWNAMITKYLDLSCLVAGDKYDVSVKYRVVDSSGNGVDCGSSCPHVVLTPYKPGQSWQQAIFTDGTYDPNGWNTITGQFTIPNDVDTWNSVHISFMETGRTVTGDFIVDDWTVTKVVQSS